MSPHLWGKNISGPYAPVDPVLTIRRSWIWSWAIPWRVIPSSAWLQSHSLYIVFPRKFRRCVINIKELILLSSANGEKEGCLFFLALFILIFVFFLNNAPSDINQGIKLHVWHAELIGNLWQILFLSEAQKRTVCSLSPHFGQSSWLNDGAGVLLVINPSTLFLYLKSTYLVLKSSQQRKLWKTLNPQSVNFSPLIATLAKDISLRTSVSVRPLWMLHVFDDWHSQVFPWLRDLGTF